MWHANGTRQRAGLFDLSMVRAAPSITKHAGPPLRADGTGDPAEIGCLHGEISK